MALFGLCFDLDGAALAAFVALTEANASLDAPRSFSDFRSRTSGPERPLTLAFLPCVKYFIFGLEGQFLTLEPTFDLQKAVGRPRRP